MLVLCVFVFVGLLHAQKSERRRRRGRVRIDTSGSGRSRTEDDIRNTRRRLASIVDPRKSKSKTTLDVIKIIDEEMKFTKL